MDKPAATPAKTPSAAPQHPGRPTALTRDVAARRADIARRAMVATWMRRLSPPR
jgi:hypothetical protein